MSQTANGAESRAPERGSRAARVASALIAVALVAWALSDDPLIGGGQGFGWTQAAVLIVGLALAASCVAAPRWNARLLAAVVSTALALAFAELAMRSVYSARYYRPSIPDPHTIYSLRPGSTREHKLAEVNGGGRILYSINSAGYRGDELSATHDRPRIAVYGDSFIQAEFAPLPDTFAERLEARVSLRLGVPVEVVNAGVAGYGPDQILNKMEPELVGLAPDLVVVGLFAGNDFGDLMRNKLYRLNADGELEATSLSIDPTLARQLEISGRESIVKVILRTSMKQLIAAYRAASGAPLTGLERAGSLTPKERVDFVLEQHTREYEDYIVRGDGVVRELSWDSWDADVGLTPGSDSARYKVALLDRIVARMQFVADGHSVPLVLLLIPHPVDVGGHDSLEVDRHKYPEYRPSGLTDELEGIADRNGVACLNLYGPFSARGPRDLYLRGLDDHWNARGQDLAAELMTEFLASHGMLDALERRFAQGAGRGREP